MENLTRGIVAVPGEFLRDNIMNATPGKTLLTCRNIWKVYAEHLTPYFQQEVANADAAELSARMRDDGAIPAAVDVSF